jgi:membrane-associated phospholipid phosphatase
MSTQTIRLAIRFGMLIAQFSILILCATVARAEPATRAVHADLTRFWRSTKQIAMSPAHANAGDWRWAGGLACTVALASLADRSVRAEAAHWDRWDHRDLSRLGHDYQRVEVMFGTAALAYGAGLAFDKPTWRRTGTEIVQAAGIAAAGSFLMKSTLGRSRPYHDDGPYQFAGPTLRDGYHSFPSGDVTEAFVLSSVLAAEIRSWPVRVALYALAATTAFQRVDADRHWASDVTGAAIWGTVVGWGVVKVNQKLKR